MRRLSEARRTRAHARLPRLDLIIGTVVAFTAGFIAWAISDAPPDGSAEYHFRNEGGAVTRLSGLYLVAAVVLSLGALAVAFNRREAGAWLWLVLTLGFAFLAVDERLQLHEQFGDMMKQVSSGPFRNWNDVAVILYGVVALAILAALAPSLLRYRMVGELFVVAFAFYAAHTLIDASANTTLSVIAEEAAKLFSGAFLALAAGAGLLGVLLNKDRPPSEAHADLADRLKPR